jgi:DNA-binding CsgD family transcriptional regulator
VLIEGVTIESLWPWIVVAQELVHPLSLGQRSAAAAALGSAGVGAINTLVGDLLPAAEGRSTRAQSEWSTRQPPTGTIDRTSAHGNTAGRPALFAAFRYLLEWCSNERPLLLLFDNLQRFDESSVELFRQLLPTLQRASVMLVVTLRDPSQRITDGHRSLVAELLHGPNVNAIEPRRLSSRDVMILARSREVELTSEEASRIANESGGNPLFVLELLRAILEARSARANSDVQSSLSEARVLRRISSVIQHRFSALQEDTQKLLQMAALLGRHVSNVELSALSLVNGDLLASLTEAERAGFISSEPHHSYRFTHELVRRAVVATIPAAEQSRISVSAACQLEESYGQHAERHAARLAALFLRGNTEDARDRGIRYSLITANRAIETYAWESALATADDLLAQYGTHLDRDTTSRLRLARGSALFRLARRYEAFEEFLAVFDYFYEMRDLDAIITLLRNHSYVEAGDVEVHHIARQALRLLTPGSSREFDVRYHYAFTCNAAIGDYESALEQADRLVQLAQSAPDPVRSTLSLSKRAYILIRLRRFEQAKEHIRRLPELDPDQAPLIANYATMVRAGLARIEGRTELAMKLYQRCVEIVRLTDDTALTATMIHFVARMTLHRGDWPSAMRLSRKSAELHAMNGNAFHQFILACYYSGSFDEGDKKLAELLEQSSKTPTLRGTIPANAACSIALRFASTGERTWTDCGKWIAATIIGDTHAHPVPVARAAFALAHILRSEERKDGEVDRALVELAREGLEVNSRYAVLQEDYALYAQALLADLDGDQTALKTLLQQAAAHARRISNLPALAWVLGEIATRFGDSDARREATEIASRLGMGPLLRTLNAARLPTKRELEVLRLVAEGLTNQEIAASLGISMHTVSRHVGNILRKLECASRTEAVSTALRLGLIRIK